MSAVCREAAAKAAIHHPFSVCLSLSPSWSIEARFTDFEERKVCMSTSRMQQPKASVQQARQARRGEKNRRSLLSSNRERPTWVCVEKFFDSSKILEPRGTRGQISGSTQAAGEPAQVRWVGHNCRKIQNFYQHRGPKFALPHHFRGREARREARQHPDSNKRLHSAVGSSLLRAHLPRFCPQRTEKVRRGEFKSRRAPSLPRNPIQLLFIPVS